jgi:hypothetical protein
LSFIYTLKRDANDVQGVFHSKKAYGTFGRLSKIRGFFVDLYFSRFLGFPDFCKFVELISLGLERIFKFGFWMFQIVSDFLRILGGVCAKVYGIFGVWSPFVKTGGKFFSPRIFTLSLTPCSRRIFVRNTPHRNSVNF